MWNLINQTGIQPKLNEISSPNLAKSTRGFELSFHFDVTLTIVV